MRRKKKSDFILFLTILLLGIGIGYASLGTNLSIEGTSDLRKTTWDIHFENVVETSGGVTPNSTTSINAAGNTVTFNIDLDNPGQFYEFTVDAVNAGTVDGMIESVTSTLNGGSISNLPECLTYSTTYSDDVAIAPKHLLAENSTATYKIRVEFKTDVDEEGLPGSNQTLNLAFTVHYVQADDSAIPKPGFIDEVFTVSEFFQYVGRAIPETVVTYDTYQGAISAFGRDFFVRQVLESGIIKESYVGFVKGGTLYYLRGGVNEADSNEKPIYEENKNVLNAAFGSSNCSYYMDQPYAYRCSVSGWYAGVHWSGNVDVGDGNYGCYVDWNGDAASYCGR